MDYRKGFDDEVTSFAREILRAKLERCKPNQIDLFNKMYVSIDEIPMAKMNWAYHQVCVTLAENG